MTELPEPPADPLALPEEQVFKHDRRSRVWSVRDQEGNRWVIKHFLHSPHRQRLTAKLNVHPVQREFRWSEKLEESGVPVVPVATTGVGMHGRHWLVCPYMGVSLEQWLIHCDPVADLGKRRDLIRQIGKITGQLLAGRLLHREYKASSLVIDDAGVLRLIDAGLIRSARELPLLARALMMLTSLSSSVIEAAGKHAQPTKVAPTRTDRLRLFRSLASEWDSMPDGLARVLRSKEFG